MIWGKLNLDGTLTDIANRPQQTWADGSTDVMVAFQPSGFGPFRYDAPSQAAVQIVNQSLLQLITAITALTATQKTNIWNDITSGTPKKWELDVGINAGPIWAMASMLQILVPLVVPASNADVTAARIRAVAMYVQDNPNYLVNPSFDPTINVPGRV